MKAAILCALIVLGVGCTTTLPAVELVDPAWALSTPAPDDVAGVYLLDHQRSLSMKPPNSAPFMEWQEHRVFKVLSEKGFPVGSTHIELPRGARLKELRARTITPSGEVVHVDVSSVLSSTYQAENRTGKTWSFQFPRVEVGSVLEYTTTIVYDYPLHWFSGNLIGKYPIEDFRVEIVVDKWAKPDLLITNAQPTLRQQVLPDGRTLIGFSMQHLKPRVEAPFSPTRELEPTWLYRTVEWRYRDAVVRGVPTWGAAAAWWLHDIVADDTEAGVFSVRNQEACAGELHCLTRVALTTLREDVALSSFTHDLSVRSLQEVKAARLGTSTELAVALWSMLRSVKVDAHLAPMNRRRLLKVQEDFPSTSWLNHLVVFVPTDDGGLWIDPSCESCEPGALPSWSRGARAFTIAPNQEFSRELSASPFVDVTGRPAPVHREARDIDVVLTVTGDVEVAVTQVAAGEAATDWSVRLANKTEAELRTERQRQLAKMSPVAELLQVERVTCDRQAGRCSQQYRYRLPGYATVVDHGASLLVLPPELDGTFDDGLLVKQAPRTAPISFAIDRDLQERVTVHAPAGYVIDLEVSGHKRRHKETEGLRVDVDAVATDDGAQLTRNYQATAGLWPASRLPEFHEVLKPARTFKRNTLTFVKSPAPESPPAPSPAAASP